MLISRVLGFLLGFMTWHSENNLSRFPSKYLKHLNIALSNSTQTNRKCPLNTLCKNLMTTYKYSKIKLNNLPLHKFLFVPVKVTEEYSGYRSRVLEKTHLHVHLCI